MKSRFPAALVRTVAPLRTQVEAALRDAISNGRLFPGDRLVERELCESLGVSRPLVREALRQLEAEGLITALPNRGPTVTVIDGEDASKLFAVRAELEGFAARCFAEQASEAEVAELRRAIERVESLVATLDAEKVRVAKNAFYEILMRGSGNAVLSQMLQMLHNRIQLFRTTNLNEPGRMAEVACELRAIVTAIENHDGDQARIRSVEHINNAAAALRRAYLRRHPGDKLASDGALERADPSPEGRDPEAKAGSAEAVGSSPQFTSPDQAP